MKFVLLLTMSFRRLLLMMYAPNLEVLHNMLEPLSSPKQRKKFYTREMQYGKIFVMVLF